MNKENQNHQEMRRNPEVLKKRDSQLRKLWSYVSGDPVITNMLFSGKTHKIHHETWFPVFMINSDYRALESILYNLFKQYNEEFNTQFTYEFE